MLLIGVIIVNWGQLFPGKVLLFNYLILIDVFLSHHLLGSWDSQRKKRGGKKRDFFLEVAKVCLEKAMPQWFSLIGGSIKPKVHNSLL